MELFDVEQGFTNGFQVFAPGVTYHPCAEGAVGEHVLEQVKVVQQEVVSVSVTRQQGDMNFKCLGHHVGLLAGT
ncbi:hypothetical protein D3C84_897720 [compost metagenome]